jgi:deazaflavin-dependent oxidoreductase (nitroreductase family)
VRRQITFGAGGVVVALITLWMLFILAMRTKFRPVLIGIRTMNRAVINPRTMKTAGRPGAYASVIRHVGRRSGTAYETPVVVRPTDDGFAIVLPYGSHSDWLKNVTAAGRAVVLHEGHTYSVDDPRVRPVAAADPYLSAMERRNNRLYGIRDVLLLRRTDAE